MNLLVGVIVCFLLWFTAALLDIKFKVTVPILYWSLGVLFGLVLSLVCNGQLIEVTK
jgi:hypothetical protein